MLTVSEYEYQISVTRAEKQRFIDRHMWDDAAKARDQEKEWIRLRKMAVDLVDEVGEAMFERFTDRARRVAVLSQEEARILNHNYIGTEHILLGLIHEGEGVAAKALQNLGIDLDVVRKQVEVIIGLGEQSPSGHIPFTPRAKKVLELSLREALQLGHNYIGTEHILLGLIREGEGVGSQVLVKLGAELTRVRQQVIQLLSGYEGKLAAEAAQVAATAREEGIEQAARLAASAEALTKEQERLDVLREADHNRVVAARMQAARTALRETHIEPSEENTNVYASQQVHDLLSDAFVLASLFADHDIEPNVTLIAQLMEWKSR